MDTTLTQVSPYFTPVGKGRKRSEVELEHSPVGTFTISEISNLLDQKLQPIVDKLNNVSKIELLESKVDGLEKENEQLRERLKQQEVFLRRDNIKVIGMTEQNDEDCESVLLDLLLPFCPSFDNRTFKACHRLGPKRKDSNRPILARFHHPKDKGILMQKCKIISQKHNLLFVDDYPKEVEANRKHLMPIFRKAKEIYNGNPKNTPRLVNDALILEGNRYEMDTLDKLPAVLKPERIYTPRKNGITAFFTRFSPLSNHYRKKNDKVQFKIDGVEYTCMEQYFMVQKATMFNDKATVEKLFQEEDPILMKRIGGQVEGYVHRRWVQDCEEKLVTGLTAKFTQNPDLRLFLLETKKDRIVEASRSALWGVGVGLTNPDLWQEDKWRGKNIMGKLLMKVREQLA